MRYPKPLTEAEIADIRARRMHGEACYLIARVYRRRSTLIKEICADIMIKTRNGNALDPAIIERIQELRMQGMKQRDVAAELGISRACVQQYDTTHVGVARPTTRRQQRRELSQDKRADPGAKARFNECMERRRERAREVEERRQDSIAERVRYRKDGSEVACPFCGAALTIYAPLDAKFWEWFYRRTILRCKCETEFKLDQVVDFEEFEFILGKLRGVPPDCDRDVAAAFRVQARRRRLRSE